MSVFKSNINILRSITLTLKILKCLKLDKIESYDKYLLKKIGIDILALYIPINNRIALIQELDCPSESNINNNIIETRFNNPLDTKNNIDDDRPQGTNRRMISTFGVLESINDSDEQEI